MLNQVKAHHDQFAGAFAAGDAGHLAISDGRQAANLWFECGGLHRSPPNLYDLDLGQRGFGAVYAGNPRDNELSLKSHTRLGFELLYLYRAWRLFGLGWHTLERPERIFFLSVVS